jgi:TRAP-type C4-dicarboxylate transport system permease small subunit
MGQGAHAEGARRLIAKLRRAAGLVAGLMFAAVFLIFMLKVVLRYAFAIQLAWADELCAVLFVWIIFWANAFLVPERDQIRFDLAVRALPSRGQRIADALRTLILAGLVIAALPGAIGYLVFLGNQRTPVLELRLDLVYACFGIFLVAVALRAVLHLVRLCRSA